jgi:hypothetical protein
MALLQHQHQQQLEEKEKIRRQMNGGEAAFPAGAVHSQYTNTLPKDMRQRAK